MRRAILALALAISWLAVAFTVHTLATSQNNLWSPTTGTVSGLQLTTNYNNALDSLNQCNNGSSAPTNQPPPPGPGTPSLGNCWLDTSVAGAANYKRYDGTSWLTLGTFDTTNHIWQSAVGGGAPTLASAATTDLCSVPGYIVQVTGTATITSFGTTCAVGQMKVVDFINAASITNGPNIQIPGASSGTATSGDRALAIYFGGNVWALMAYYSINAKNCAPGTPTNLFAVTAGLVTHC